MKIAEFLNAILSRLLSRFWSHTSSNDWQSSCSLFFEGRKDNDENFWTDLDREHPKCSCEKHKVSKFSPGPVLDAEIILSVVTSRIYVDHNGKIEPTVFDSKIAKGMSVDRFCHTTAPEFDGRANKLVDGDSKKEFCGLIAIEVRSIREVAHEGVRCFAVYDTGLEDNSCHAEIAMTDVPAPKTPGRKKIRSNLRRKLLDSCLFDRRVILTQDIFKNVAAS